MLKKHPAKQKSGASHIVIYKPWLLIRNWSIGQPAALSVSKDKEPRLFRKYNVNSTPGLQLLFKMSAGTILCIPVKYLRTLAQTRHRPSFTIRKS